MGRRLAATTNLQLQPYMPTVPALTKPCRLSRAGYNKRNTLNMSRILSESLLLLVAMPSWRCCACLRGAYAMGLMLVSVTFTFCGAPWGCICTLTMRGHLRKSNNC